MKARASDVNKITWILLGRVAFFFASNVTPKMAISNPAIRPGCFIYGGQVSSIMERLANLLEFPLNSLG
jgi:hypothetical protein